MSQLDIRPLQAPIEDDDRGGPTRSEPFVRCGEVYQATTEVLFNAPGISTREKATQVLVKDGQTIVLGGPRILKTDPDPDSVTVQRPPKGVGP